MLAEFETLAEPPRSLLRQAVTCKVASSFSLCALNRETWDGFASRTRSGVYLSYDWCATWWKFYGAGRQLRILTFFSGGKLIGLLPLYIDCIGKGPLSLRVAKLIGSNIPPKAFGLPVDASFAEAVFHTCLQHLLVSDRCDLVSFGPISELQGVISQFESVCRNRKETVGLVSVDRDVHSVFWLPKSMDEYYASLSDNERKNRRKYELRPIRKEHHVVLEVITESEKVELAFEQFVNQHTTQWRAEGKTGHFGAWPHALEYNRALVRALGALGRLRFIRIVVDGKVIASQYAFAFGNAWYWELPSRDLDPRWARASLGPTGIVNMIRAGIEEGVEFIEGGLTHYDYKVRLGASEQQVSTVRACSRRFASRIRLRAFLLLRKIVQILYHRIWYRRIAPRLSPRFWRPQPLFWLRLDF